MIFLSKSLGTLAANISVLGRSLRNRSALLSFLSTGVLIVMLCLVFVPRWETSDDVHMSMIAHGYGIASYGSPNLLYSNVLWGYLVRSIPAINGVLGYSLATVAVLLAIGWAMLYFMLRLGANYLLSLLVIVLVIVQPTLFPQFTVNAGLLTVAAVMGLWVHARFKDFGSLLVACLLAFFGYLLREREFFLILGVALPLLPWQELRQQRAMRIALAVLALVIALAAAFNHQAYSGHEWKPFKEMDSTIPFTNYDVGEYLKQRPDILVRYGYSKNDIDLISASFLADPHIANPKALNAMVAELGPLFMQKGYVKSGFASLGMLTNYSLLPLLLSGFFLLVMAPRRSVAFTWALCLAALFAIGMTGHPAVLRVYFPLVSLLLMAPVALGHVKEGMRQWIAILMLLVACVGNAYLLVPGALGSKDVIRQLKKDVRSFPASAIVIWGHSFPFEVVFPVFLNNPKRRDSRIAQLSAMDYAPFSVAMAEEKAGRGMIKRFCSSEGIPLFTSAENIHLLGIYCRERLGGELQGTAMRKKTALMIQRVRCDRTQREAQQASK